MTRAEILSLVGQLTNALAESHTPTQFSEEDRDMLKSIHAAIVSQKRTVAPGTVVPVVPSEIHTSLTVQETQEVPMFASVKIEPEGKKKSFWKKLGSGMKTALAGVAFGAGGGALGAVVDAVKDGNFNPGSIAATAAIAAVTGAVGYYQKSPKDQAKEE
jgi:hypothetical protein